MRILFRHFPTLLVKIRHCILIPRNMFDKVDWVWYCLNLCLHMIHLMWDKLECSLLNFLYSISEMGKFVCGLKCLCMYCILWVVKRHSNWLWSLYNIYDQKFVKKNAKMLSSPTDFCIYRWKMNFGNVWFL